MASRIVSLAHLTVIELSPPELVTAAAAAGFSHVGLRLRPPSPEQRQPPILGDTPMRRELLRRLDDTGVRVLDVEIVRLLPGQTVADFEPLLETGARLGARYVLVSGEIPDASALADAFAAFCGLAAGHNLVAALEFMPWTSVRSLAEARALVETADHPNGRILVDAIHLDRAGEGAADLAGIDPSRLAYFHLCDAPRERPADLATMLHQARAARLPPGEGGLDLSGMLAALPADMPIGVEVPMRAWTEPPAQRAAGLLAATRALLARTFPGVP